jgi:hypothetical protein
VSEEEVLETGRAPMEVVVPQPPPELPMPPPPEEEDNLSGIFDTIPVNMDIEEVLRLLKPAPHSIDLATCIIHLNKEDRPDVILRYDDGHTEPLSTYNSGEINLRIRECLSKFRNALRETRPTNGAGRSRFLSHMFGGIRCRGSGPYEHTIYMRPKSPTDRDTELLFTAFDREERGQIDAEIVKIINCIPLPSSELRMSCTN